MGEEPYLNYKKISVQLGLHKDSYNYLNESASMKKMSNTQKLKLLYSSIDPNSSDYKRNKSSNLNNNHQTPNSSRIVSYN